MPFLKQQIQLVNSSLKALALADARFSGALIADIAKDAIRSAEPSETYPVYMNDSYEAQDLTASDNYPLVLYHKIKQITYKPFGNNSTGTRVNMMTGSMNIKAVIYGKYAALRLTREELEGLFVTEFPDNFSGIQVKGIGLIGLQAIFQSSNLDSAQVWGEEYKNIACPIAPEDIYFSINYQLESLFDKNCFKICDCEAYNNE